jgi:hypothetical protein
VGKIIEAAAATKRLTEAPPEAPDQGNSPKRLTDKNSVGFRSFVYLRGTNCRIVLKHLETLYGCTDCCMVLEHLESAALSIAVMDGNFWIGNP